MEINNRYLANHAIDSFIIPDNDCWAHKFIEDTDIPRCSWSERTIYSPMLPPIINATADAVIRGKNMHEAGHGRLTRCDKDASWTPLMGNVANALEDLRIEKGISKLGRAIAEDIKAMNKAIIPRVMRRFCDAQAGQVRPLDEALFALHAMEDGFAPTWKVSEIAQKYIDAAKEAFGEWRDCDCDTTAGYKQIVKVAEKVVKCFEEAKREMQQQGNQGEQGQGSNQQQGDGKGQGGQSCESEQSQNDNEGNDSVASGDTGKGNGEGKESENGDNAAKNAQGNNKGGEGNNNANGNENNDNGNDNTQESVDGKDGENAESDEGANAGDEGDNGNGDDNDNASKSSKSNKQMKRPQGASDIEDDFSGNDYKEDEIRKVIKNACDESVQEFGSYTAYTSEDEIKPAMENEASYAKSKARAAGMVSKLRSHLEESLKAMNRCKVIGNRDCGELDSSMLPYLAKSLTRNVFCETIDGISLDTTVSILIDESGSIGGTCEIFKTMAIAFSEALERIGIKYEILGHTTKCKYGFGFDRQMPMIIFEHKRFNQPLRKERNRLGSIGSYACNVDGEALLHAWKRAIAQRAKRHIVFVLSDGLPNGGYHNEKLYNHLKKTVEYIRKDGGEVYAIGIGTRKPAKYYGEKNFFYAEGGDSINTIFFKRIAEAIAKDGRK